MVKEATRKEEASRRLDIEARTALAAAAAAAAKEERKLLKEKRKLLEAEEKKAGREKAEQMGAANRAATAAGAAGGAADAERMRTRMRSVQCWRRAGPSNGSKSAARAAIKRGYKARRARLCRWGYWGRSAAERKTPSMKQ